MALLPSTTLTSYAVAMAAVAAIPASAQVAPAAAPAGLPLLTLSVTGEVERAPDMVTIGTGVQTRAPVAKDAMAQNAAQMDKLVAAIVKAGVARKDIQTSAVNLSPQYDYSGNNQPPRFIGYEASNQLTVKLRDIAKSGDVIDRMVNAGATNINGPSFGFADDAPLLDEARAKALDQAKQRAQFYATRAGYRSVRLIGISESGAMMPGPIPMMVRSFDAAQAATKVEPGQINVGITLTVQYALEP